MSAISFQNRISLNNIAFTCLIAMAAILSCAKEEQSGQISPSKNAHSIIQSSDAKTLMTNLLNQQDAIINSPADASLRKKLLETSVDETRQVARAAGQGKPSGEALTAGAARQAAERAAFVDACRWLAYILEWRDHIEKPDYGKIEKQLPGAQTVYTDASNDTMTFVLVETNLSASK